MSDPRRDRHTGDPLRLEVQPRLPDATLVLAFDGWNDAGESATAAARFLEDAVACAPLGVIESEEYYDFTVRRPAVTLGEGGVREIRWPDFRFRYGAIPGRCELVVGTGGEPHLRWSSFCDQVVRLTQRVGLRRVILLGAFLADVLYSLPVRVSGFASDPAWIEKLGVAASGYEGPTGIVGVLAERFRREGLEVISLWAGLPHYVNLTPNPRGSLALVQKVGELIDLPMDLHPLENESAEFVEKVADLIQNDPVLAEYIKDLKRRAFAQ